MHKSIQSRIVGVRPVALLRTLLFALIFSWMISPGCTYYPNRYSVGWRVRGKIVDRLGKPLPSGTVVVIRPYRDGLPFAIENGSGVTDANGQFDAFIVESKSGEIPLNIVCFSAEPLPPDPIGEIPDTLEFLVNASSMDGSAKLNVDESMFIRFDEIEGVPAIGLLETPTISVELADSLPFSVYLADDEIRAFSLFDADGDGLLDIAAAVGPTRVRLLTNDGHGRFPNTFNIAAGTDVNDLAADDFDNDGDIDLAIRSRTHYRSQQPDISPTLQVLFNNGAGRFAAGPLLETAYESEILSGDLDADGDLDLVADRVRFFNDGTGSFSEIHDGPQTWPTLLVLDTHGDRVPKLIQSAVEYGEPTSLFSRPTGFELVGTAKFSTDLRPNQAAAGDFDGDGLVDVCIIEFPQEDSQSNWDIFRNMPLSGTGRRLRLYLNTGLGGLAAPRSFAIDMQSKSYLSAGDINGDAAVDIVVAANIGDPFDGLVLLNNGAGEFNEASPISFGGGARQPVVADLDANGQPDIVVTLRYGISVMLNPILP